MRTCHAKGNCKFTCWLNDQSGKSDIRYESKQQEHMSLLHLTITFLLLIQTAKISWKDAVVVMWNGCEQVQY